MCRLSPDSTAGTHPCAGPDTDVTSGEHKGRAELLCSQFPDERTFPQTPVCPEYPPPYRLRRTEQRCQVSVVPCKHAATSWIKIIKTGVAHQTSGDAVNKKPCFFLGMWAWGAAGAQALRTSSPKPDHQSSLSRHGRWPFPKGRASPVFCAFLQCDWTLLPLRGGSPSPLFESEWARTHFAD